MASFLHRSWAVFLLFTIPFGPGIPGGVLLAKKEGLSWVATAAIYFLSDIEYPLIFEPLMLLCIAWGKKSPLLRRMTDLMRQSVQRTTAGYGTGLGPLTHILIAFGIDPMTGRAVNKAAGHGFVTGWAMAITGDMMYFTVIMVSTLWLNRWLNPTATIFVIIGGMLIVPGLIRRLRERVKKAS